MQIVLGSKQLWEVVSFSGNFDSNYLRDLVKAKAVACSQRDERAAAVAPQHSDQHDDQHDDQPDTKQLKANATKCKGDLRWAKSLKKKQDTGCSDFGLRDRELLRDLDSGTLLRLANDAVRAHGHGRIYKEDGSFTDIGPETGGLTRTFLDGWTPPADFVDEPNVDERNVEEEGDPPDWSQ